MPGLLERLRRRGSRQTSADDIDGFGDPFSAAVAPAPRAASSVWERLAGDPGAAALRAQWEARWDEF